MKNLLDLIVSKYPSGYTGKFITFGLPLVDGHLLAAHWMGLAIRPLGHEGDRAVERSLMLTRIVGQLAEDCTFRRTMAGYWSRAFSPREVFDQFAGPHDLIVMNTDSIDRWIWSTDQVQASAPHVYVMPEDGHNEGVTDLAKKRRYTREIADGYLVMSHDGKHDYCRVCKT